jgi:glutamyl-tRNA synthetase
MTQPRPVRTRFAPSPTGFQHIGGFRTAFYAYLLAKKHGGQFLLRIEDTDQERLVPGAIKYIIEELGWFGIHADEGPSRSELEILKECWDGAPELGGAFGPYVQSQRLPKYQAIAQQLIDLGVAYRCDCSSERLEHERFEQMARRETPGYSGFCRGRDVSKDVKHVIRFKMPPRAQVVLHDAVRGRIEWDNPPLRDPVLLKSDGFPTYHLACVVDDHDMQISHVMRGEEWLSTAPLHILLYQALNWEMPIFAHLPVVKGSDGKKLSKRHGATLASAFRDDGYLPQAVLNYVVLVGWSPGEGDNQEIFTHQELIEKFSLEHVSEASAVFDYSKLQWMNGVYIRNLSVDEFLHWVTPFLESAGVRIPEPTLRKLSPLIQERIRTFKEAAPMLEFLMDAPLQREWESVFKKNMTNELCATILTAAREAVRELSEFTEAKLEERFKAVAESVGVKAGQFLSTTRIAVLAKAATPPLYESLVCLGAEKVVARLTDAINEVATRPAA